MIARKITIGVAVLAFLLLAMPLGAQDSVGQPFTIKIRPLKAAIDHPNFVVIEIVLTNTSADDINGGSAYDGSIDAAYSYEVWDQYGNPAPRKSTSGPPYRPAMMMRTLKPGESATENSNVARWVDFSQPGKYTIQVSRLINGNIGDPVVKSNIIAITVLPADGPARASP